MTFLGSYADLKIVKTRSVVQVIIEVPIERGKEVTDLLGLPHPGEEIPVAIARIDPSKLRSASAADLPTGPRSANARRAGILCNEGGFQAFLSERIGHEISGSEAAATVVRKICGVVSRRDLDTNANAATKWRDLKADYEVWLFDVERRQAA